jgi:NTE family protein
MRLLSSAVLIFLLSFPCLAQDAFTAQQAPASEGRPYKDKPRMGTIYRSLTQQAAAEQASAKPPARKRLTIGVALEGGGALGIAHMGVLKWFEENHIPIDYIAGTSIGGLVGGIYATGKTADEMKQVVENANWHLLLGGETPYPDLSFRRKEDARDVPNGIKIGLKHGPSLPPGLNSGQQISLLIDRETLPYSTIPSFNDLPIPFRCVSTELISGKPYVFQSGSLSEAMRATMSLPGVFDPVRQGDKIFVDGGLVDNLPTDVVRTMGADVVIAVHLQISKATAKDITSAFSVLGRSVELVIAETELRGMAGADLIVKANVEDFSTMDYEKAEALFQKGYEAAAEKAQILMAYSLDDAAWAEYQAWKKSRKRTTIGVPQFVKVEGVGFEAARDIESFLRPLVGKPVNIEDVDNYLTRLTGTGRYDSATYGMIHEDGRDGLLVRVSEKSYAPPLLQPSFAIDGSQPQDVTFTLGARITAMDITSPRSEWRTDIQFGETYGIQTQLYLPFRRLSKWFWEPFVGGSQTTFNVYQKSNPRADYRLDRVLGGVNLGYTFNRFNQVYVGYGIGYSDASLRLGQPEFSSYSGRVGAAQFVYTRDHTNEPVIPTQGYYLQSRFFWYDTSPAATEAFPSLDLYAGFFHPVWAKGSGFLIARGGSTFGSTGTGTPQFFLGGPNLLSSYGLNELFGDQYFLGRVGYLYRIFTLPPLFGKQVYLYGAGEVGKMYNDPTAPKLSGDGAIGLLAETLFGPVLIGGSVGDTGHHKWFFQLGRVF